MITRNNKKLSEEFAEFLSASELPAPLVLREAVLSEVHRDLNPSHKTVFLKMLGIHSAVSLLSLSICSQFGIKVLPLYDAMDAMMSVVGHTYCMAFCGLLYLGISALAFSLVLRPEEVKVIRRHKVLQLTLLSGLSLGVFLCLGAEVLLIPGILWLIGSLIGGIATLEVGWLLRAKLRRQLVFGN